MKQNAHDIAIRYLANRPRTAYEIKKHLVSKEFDEKEINECLNNLTDSKLIDDEDYCERYIIYAMEKGRGPLRIKKELYERGISREIVQIGLENYFGDENEQKAAMKFVEKLLSRDNFTHDEKGMAKLARRLVNQGYNANAIYNTLEKVRDKIYAGVEETWQ